MKIDLWPVMYFPGVDTGIAGSSDIISCKMKAQDNAKKKKKKKVSVLCAGQGSRRGKKHVRYLCWQYVCWQIV